MKKILLAIITMAFVINCSAESNIRIPLFGKRKNKTRCEWRGELRRNRKKKVAIIASIVVPFVLGGFISDNN